MSEIEFIKCMKILSASYMKDLDEDTIQIWYIQFKNIKYQVLYNSIQKLIKTNKYFPSISQLLDQCSNEKENIKFDILEKMKQDGYFKTLEEYDKANNFLQENIIPSWFREDMKKYYQASLTQNTTLQLGE